MSVIHPYDSKHAADDEDDDDDDERLCRPILYGEHIRLVWWQNIFKKSITHE